MPFGGHRQDQKMKYFYYAIIIHIIILIFLLTPTASNSVTNYKWGGKGKLYDQRNQYVVACRLVKEKRVEPFFGEDSVKCHYRCQDYKEVRDEFVITTHSNHTCMKQVTQPRGDKRDWRSR